MPNDSCGSKQSACGMWSKMERGLSRTMKFVCGEKMALRDGQRGKGEGEVAVEGT